jgi:hypothetical protein
MEGATLRHCAVRFLRLFEVYCSYDPGGKTRATWNAFVVTSHFPSMQ